MWSCRYWTNQMLFPSGVAQNPEMVGIYFTAAGASWRWFLPVLTPESPKLLRALSLPGRVLFQWLLLWDQFQGVCVGGGVGGLPHRRGALQFNSALTLSTWRRHQLPPAKGSVPQDRPQLQAPVTSAGCHLCLWPDRLWIVGSNDPLLGFD